MPNLKTLLFILFAIGGFIIIPALFRYDETLNEKNTEKCPTDREKYLAEYPNDGRCTESCHNSLFVFFPIMLGHNLTLANGETCASLGYQNYFNTLKKGNIWYPVYYNVYRK